MEGQVITNPFEKIDADLSLIKAQLQELLCAHGGNNPQTSKRYYSIEEAAEVLKVSKITVYRQAQSGKIPSKKIGSRVMIPGTFLDNNG